MTAPGIGADPPFGLPGDDLEPVPAPTQAVSALAPAWAMAAQAIEVRDQAHLREGLHLRVMTNPLLGLPVTPFRILAAPFPKPRTDITWTDDAPFPKRLTPPFAVTPNRPAIGWLPPAAVATCCWIQVFADVAPGDELTMSAMASTPRGPRAVSTRSSRPYRVWASAVERVRVEGTGTVERVEWWPASTEGGALIDLMALPLDRPHPRYAALDGGVALAAARVVRGAPQRRALYDTDGLPSPGAAPALAVAAEVARVGALAGAIRPNLLALVDTDGDPWLLESVERVLNEQGDDIGASTSNRLDTVLNGTVDHGLARWLGYLDVVPAFTDDETSAHIVTAVFAPNWTALAEHGLSFSLPPDAVIADLTALGARYPDFAALDDLAGVDGPFLDIGVVAAHSRTPLDPPRPPEPVGVTDQPTRTSDVEVGAVSAWLPRVPPDAARETAVTLDGLGGGAAVAFARDDGTGPIVLNRPSGAAGFRGPLVAAPVVGESADLGTLAERDCPAGAVSYHAAQVDWFGRWSDWAAIDLAAGDRPRPPTPAVRAWVTPAAVPDGDRGPLAATISATIPVPPPADLPPGGRLLTSLRFQVTDAAGDTTTTILPIDDPAAPPPALTVDLAGPPLLPARSTAVTVSAHWTDTAFARSDPSPDLALTVADPRPPDPVVVDPALRYTARPDGTGQARVDLRWPAASPQERFRVYAADETTLRVRLAALRDDAATPADDAAEIAGLLTALDEAPGPVQRGTAWTAHARVLPRSAFTPATPSPLSRTGPEMRFEHAVSGALRTLSLYRIVAVSATNVDVDFAASPVVPFAVPNTLPPPQPHLAVRIVDREGTATAELTVSVPRGSRRAVEYRLRRSRLSGADPLLMPVVTTGPLHPPAPGAAHVEAVVDAGPSTLEPDGRLLPWNTYTWRVEVRGEPDPEGPPGPWSEPSPAAGAAVVPSGPPPAPAIRSVRERDGRVAVGVTVPSDLRGGALGVYTVELYRRLPGEHERLLATRAEQQRPAGAAPWVFDDDGATGAPVDGTTYRAVVVDPLSRRSPPSPAVLHQARLNREGLNQAGLHQEGGGVR